MLEMTEQTVRLLPVGKTEQDRLESQPAAEEAVQRGLIEEILKAAGLEALD